MSLETISNIFNKKLNLAEELFHGNKQKDGQIDRYKNAFSSFSQFSVRI
jgi:hypothetical protein